MHRGTGLEIIADPHSWDGWLGANDAHLLQTWEWGELKRQFGWRAERIVLREREKIHAAAQVLYRRLAPGLTIAYLPRGPVCAQDASLTSFLEQVREHVRTRGVFLLKLEPDWGQRDPREDALASIGASRTDETIQPPATIQIDLTANLDTILARMKSKWRYNIRLAEKKQVTVREGTREDLGAFCELMQLTGERDHFAIHSADYYRAAFDSLVGRDRAHLFVAEHGHTPLAMIFVTAFAHEAIYLYGASGNAERNRMPNHALHWSAIQWAKARGCTRYDLWGVPENIGEPADESNLPNSLYQFKQGFGGEIVHYTGAWDVIFNPIKDRVYRTARRARQGGLA
jgi:lipid II:glycine glycyltransferase (peptidoglycan interpeptide bridge formation enzyme)